jgi:hypothetical protein
MSETSPEAIAAGTAAASAVEEVREREQIADAAIDAVTKADVAAETATEADEKASIAEEIAGNAHETASEAKQSAEEGRQESAARDTQLAEIVASQQQTLDEFRARLDERETPENEIVTEVPVDAGRTETDDSGTETGASTGETETNSKSSEVGGTEIHRSRRRVVGRRRNSA